MSEPTDATGITESTFDLLEFVKRGTSARREVEIYTDHEAAAECQRINELLADAEDDEGDADGPLGSATTVERLAEEVDPWLARLQASRMTWTVRALSAEEIDQAFEQIPPPKTPVPPKENAPRPLQEAFTDRVIAYNKSKAQVDADRRLLLISYAVEGVSTPAGTQDSVSVEDLRALRAQPHGQGWIDRLWQAVDEASSEEVEPPVPTSPGRSTSTRG